MMCESMSADLMNGFDTIEEEYVRELTVKGSRFISILRHCPSQDDIPSIVRELTKRFPDATHYCYAAISDGMGRNERSSDNGEPSGTAGRPILNVLKGSGLTDVICVVIRYFGGTLLGTGGLVHTYTESASSVVSDAVRIRYIQCARFSFTADYATYSVFESRMSRMLFGRPECEYADRVHATISIRYEDRDEFERRFSEVTERRIPLSYSGTAFVKERP